MVSRAQEDLVLRSVRNFGGISLWADWLRTPSTVLNKAVPLFVNLHPGFEKVASLVGSGHAASNNVGKAGLSNLIGNIMIGHPGADD